jgi:glycine cleavage system pyridoxal-binding protein P
MKKNMLCAFILLGSWGYADAMQQEKREKQEPSLNFVINNQWRVQSFSALNGMRFAKTNKEVHNATIWDALSLRDQQKGDLFGAIMEADNTEPSFAFKTEAGSFVANITPMLGGQDLALFYFIKVLVAQNPK